MTNKTNGNSEKYTLIIGLGYFERELVKHLRDKRSIKIIDIRESYVNESELMFPDVEFITGDSSSLVTWKKLDTQAISQVIITVRDMDVVHETCRIIRNFLKLEVMIIIISYDDYETSPLDEFNVTIVRPMQLGLDYIANLLDKNVSWPINIGNRDGEIVEVQVLKNSHLIGVKLKHIRPVSWSIALIYVNGKPQIPNANTRISIGDRVVLVGEPNVLKGVIDTMTKGEPNFPLQFGNGIALYMCQSHADLLSEALYMQKHTMAKRLHILPIGGKVPKGTAEKLKSEKVDFAIGDNINSYEDILKLKDGMIVLPKRSDMFSGRYYKKLFKSAVSPLLFTNGHEKYDRVVITLNTETPAFVLETGVELAKLLMVKFNILYVQPVESIRKQKDIDYLNLRKNLIADFEVSDGVTIEHEILEGNPVIETLNKVNSYEGETCLLVLAFDPEDSIGFFTPNVPYLLAAKAKCSVLAIPVEDTHA
jgi:hypothetical protein